MAEHELSPARLEAVSDGVFAVVLTIMVLELRPPHDPTLAGYLALWPHAAIYVVSFTTLATFWVNHRYLFSYLRRVDDRVLWSNMALLFFLSLIPFFTASVGENQLVAFTTAMYAAALTAAGLAFAALAVSVRAQYRAAEMPAVFRSRVSLIHAGAQVTHASAIPVAFVHPMLSLIMLLVPAVVYMTKLTRPSS
ncbi:MAG TPA: TMEM175 family protein [Caulobacteraceae bacterium]|nr:TMEM175 family protein [Caulobacteraceae bacterium]